MKRGIWQYDINGAFELSDAEIARLDKAAEAEQVEEQPVEEEKMEA